LTLLIFSSTLIHMIRDDNQTIFNITIHSTLRKMYVNYYCNNTNNKARQEIPCFLELDAVSLFSQNSTKANYLALKIYKNTLEIFLNQPKNINEKVNINAITLNYNLGSFLVNNSKIINYFIGNDLSGNVTFDLKLDNLV
jgi:hypothetical protein